MKKSSPTNPQMINELNKLYILDNLEEHVVVQWFMEHRRKLIIGVAAAFLLLFALYLWHARDATKAEIDYYNASLEYQKFRLGDSSHEHTYQQLDKLIARHPELKQKYGANIAQLLIDRGAVAQALPWAKDVLTRVNQDHLPSYHAYAQTSLLIAEKNYAEALQAALALKSQQLEEAEKVPEEASRSFGSALFAYNLLRIALLQQQLENPEQEADAWKEWLKYMRADPSVQPYGIDNTAFYAIANGINEGDVSLQNYVETRLRHLGLSN